jgi:hypothetical protein
VSYFWDIIFDHNGLSLNNEKISVIKNYPRPTTLRRLKSLSGLTSYFRRFIKDYSRITNSLRALLKQGAKFQWTDDCEAAFQHLRTALTSAPILAIPDFNREFFLSTDASQFTISFVLSQKDNEGRKNEINWTVSEKEALAVLEGVRHYHTYLSSRPFQIITDDLTLSYLKSMRLSGNSRLARWGASASTVPVPRLLQEGFSKPTCGCPFSR